MPPGILVVAEHPGLNQLIARVLSQASFTVHTAATGATAQTLLREHPPAVLVVDLEMVRTDGRQVISHARTRHPRCRCWR